ncbi:Vitamin B12 dependent methionine synthase activation subunit [Desulfofundulus thermocisternus]|uniref:Vitamin B12 dependent methionine synthase activation subunit n=1 Tax=Desulfofundulus thermocisternus TaxID=42471 RepID=UPI00217DCF73|nr:Vitamin B12 dependent methionine synthase activation subunit [Desulfofundulus thermocisternus]
MSGLDMYGLNHYYKLNVELAEKDISTARWDTFFKTSTSSSRALMKEMLREAQLLARAEAVCRVLPVLGVSGNKIVLEEGRALTSSLLVRLAGNARSMLLIICTLGHTIDKRVEEYNRRGLAARAYFLDVAGTCIIEAAARRLVEEIKVQLRARGLEATIPLGPGHSYWENLKDQRVIYELVNPSTIGVSILENGIMLPRKSLSMALGIGRGLPPSAENHCYYCSIRQKCPLSRARDLP